MGNMITTYGFASNSQAAEMGAQARILSGGKNTWLIYAATPLQVQAMLAIRLPSLHIQKALSEQLLLFERHLICSIFVLVQRQSALSSSASSFTQT